ncbi:MAG: flippase [Acidobacteriota bacterium]|nr:flippase [Acidobacteriota bacterium]
MLARLTKHPIVRNALSLYGIQLASYVLPLLTFPYLARVLGTGKFGLIATSQAFVGYFLVITEYGFNFSVTREISVARDDSQQLCRIYTSAMAARVLLMLGSLLLMTAIVFSFPKLRADWAVFYISFLTVIGSALFPQWLFQGLEKMGFITVREIGARLIGLLTIFFLVRTSADYLWAAAVMSGSSAVAGLVGLLYVEKLTGVRFTTTSWREIRQLLREGWHIFLSTAAITLYTRSNLFVLWLVASDAEAGMFAAASRLIEAAKGLVFPMSTSIYPHISRLAVESRPKAVSFIRKSIPRMAWPFLALSLGLGVLAPLGIHIVYGSKYDGSIPLLQIMSPIPIVVGLGVCFATFYMLGLGYKRQWSNMIMAASLFNFVVLFPLLWLMRAPYAVAITSTAVECFVTAASYLFFQRKESQSEKG